MRYVRGFRLISSSLVLLLCAAGCRVQLIGFDESATEPNSVALTLSPSGPFSLLAGESYTFSGTGGASGYTFSDSGTGFIDPVTGSYSTALGFGPLTDTVTIADLSGRTAQATVHVRAFQNLTSVSSTTSGAQTLILGAMTEMGGALYSAAKSVGSGQSITVMKSLDDGASWSQVSSFNAVLGLKTWASALISLGTDLYISGYYQVTNSEYRAFVAKSSDSGATWTTVYIHSPAGMPSEFEGYFYDIKATANGFLLLLGSAMASGQAQGFILRCDPSDWSCATVELLSSDYRAEYRSVQMDGAGNLYAAGSYTHDDPIAGGAILKKSVDHGQTWSLLYANTSLYEYTYKLAVSADGTTLIRAGKNSVSSPIVEESFDGGNTWARSTSPCSGSSGWYNYHVIMDGSKNKLLACFRPFPNTTYFFKKPFGGAWSSVKTQAGAGGGELFLTSGGTVLTVVSATAVLSSSDFGSTWTDLTAPTGATVPLDATLSSILDAGGDTLYAVGTMNTTSVQTTGAVYKSTDGGATWSQEYSVNPATSNSLSSIARSPATGTWVTSGNTFSSWQSFKKTTAGTWTLSETYTPPSVSVASLASVSASSNGDFYATGGYMDNVTFQYNWLTRISTNDGVSWSSLDTFQYVSGKSSRGYGSLVDGDDFYAVGTGNDSTGKSHWIVRKYDGSTWSIEDDDTVSATATNTIARAILKASDGYFYVAGEYTENGVQTWLVKRRPISGGAWEVSDRFNLSARNSGALSLAEDSSGRIFASGSAVDGSGVQSAVIRMKRPGGAWFTVERYSDNGRGTAAAVAPCGDGLICSAGGTLSSQNQLRGIIRRLSP